MRTPEYSVLGWIIRVMLLFITIYGEYRWYIKIIPDELNIICPGKSLVTFGVDLYMTIVIFIALTIIFFEVINRIITFIESLN